MELSSSNIKKMLIFSQKNVFLIFPEMEPCIFQPQAMKIKKSTCRKFLIFQETKTPQNFLCFRKQNFLIFQEKEALKTSYISGNNFQSSKSIIFLMFQEMELSCHKLKKLLYFWKKL